MSDGYLIRIDVWPYSTNAGAERDQLACGDALRDFPVRAESMSHALTKANLIVRGIKTNPRVWIARIRSIIHEQDVRNMKGFDYVRYEDE